MHHWKFIKPVPLDYAVYQNLFRRQLNNASPEDWEPRIIPRITQKLEISLKIITHPPS